MAHIFVAAGVLVPSFFFQCFSLL